MKMEDCRTSVLHVWNPAAEPPEPRPARARPPRALGQPKRTRQVTPRPLTELQQRALEAIRRASLSGWASGPDIAGALGIEDKQAHRLAQALHKRGLVVEDRRRRPMVYRVA